MLSPGTVLQNRYLIVRLLAEGGMGAVYLARDQRLDSVVALKETFFTDERLSKAFEREARLLARLRHPALPRVSDHFTEENGQFLIMEYIPGEDLAETLKSRAAPFPPDEVIRWADQLLDALDYLHSQEPPIVHRDIKPQNLKLTERGQIILLDFGLAKSTPLQMTRVTSSGSIYGFTPNYAPMEQIQGTGTDPRSDLYSLGATLYHLVTGVTPQDSLTRAAAVVEGQPDPLLAATELNGQVSSGFAGLLHKALAVSRIHRHATAAEMRSSLRTACEMEGGAVDQEAEVIDTPHTVVPLSCEEREQPRTLAADEEEVKDSGHDSADKETVLRKEAPTVSGGIGWLQDDVEHVGQKVRRGRTIATFVLAVVFGSGALSYFFVPSVRSRLSTFLANEPGTVTQAALETAVKTRARYNVIPSTRPEFNRNIVTARGAVDNISDEPLENLEVEVSLRREGGSPPEIRKIPIIPNPLPPSQTGTFEFEYDGKHGTGFSGYKVERLLSNGNEIKFRVRRAENDQLPD